MGQETEDVVHLHHPKTLPPQLCSRGPGSRMRRVGAGIAALVAGLVLTCGPLARAQSRDDALLARAQAEKSALVDTLRQLVEIESGSLDAKGLKRIADVLEHELAQAGASVERIPSPPSTGDTVIGRLFGGGTGSVMLMAHMDTVYPEGVLAKRPFRVEGSRFPATATTRRTRNTSISIGWARDCTWPCA